METSKLARSRKETNIAKKQAASTSQVLSGHVLVLHKSPNCEEERLIASTTLTTPQKNMKVLSEQLLSYSFAPYVDDSAKSEGAQSQALPQYQSIPELNSPSEIRMIEENVRQNERLKMLTNYRFEDDSCSLDS